MSKISKKQELLNFDNSLKAMVPLTDRGDAQNYGTLAAPRPPAGKTFIGFELNKIKKPKSIAEFIVLFTGYAPFMQQANREKFKAFEQKILNNETLTSADKVLVLNGNETVYSVFRDNKTGELYKVPQCGTNRGRSFEDTYIITKYFYKTLTWKKFINIVYRTVAIMKYPSAFYLASQGGYACGAIRKNRVCYGSQLGSVNYPPDQFAKNMFKPITKEDLIALFRGKTGQLGNIDFNESVEGILNQFARNHMFHKERRRYLFKYTQKYDSLKSMQDLAIEHIDFNDHKLYVVDTIQCLRKYLV